LVDRGVGLLLLQLNINAPALARRVAGGEVVDRPPSPGVEREFRGQGGATPAATAPLDDAEGFVVVPLQDPILILCGEEIALGIERIHDVRRSPAADER